MMNTRETAKPPVVNTDSNWKQRHRFRSALWLRLDLVNESYQKLDVTFGIYHRLAEQCICHFYHMKTSTEKGCIGVHYSKPVYNWVILPDLQFRCANSVELKNKCKITLIYSAVCLALKSNHSLTLNLNPAIMAPYWNGNSLGNGEGSC